MSEVSDRWGDPTSDQKFTILDKISEYQTTHVK